MVGLLFSETIDWAISGLEVQTQDFRALTNESRKDTLSKTLRRAGDQRNLPRETSRHNGNKDLVIAKLAYLTLGQMDKQVSC